MELQAYKGYFDNGLFYSTAGRVINLPERKEVTIILDEPIVDDEHAKHLEAWQTFLQAMQEIDDEPLPPLERVKFREVEV